MAEGKVTIAQIQAAQSAPESAPDGFVLLEYTGQARVKASRVPSGAIYRFSPDDRRRQVLPADADSLLRAGAFRRVS